MFDQVLGLFDIATFSFIVARAWNDLIRSMFEECKMVDEETGEMMIPLLQYTMYALGITAFAVLFMYYMYMGNHIDLSYTLKSPFKIPAKK